MTPVVESKIIRRHLWISGRVQGVSFRVSMKKFVHTHASKTQGWVRNLADGRVEAVVQGEADSVIKVVEWASKGPLLARVDQLEVEEETAIEGETLFEVRA